MPATRIIDEAFADPRACAVPRKTLTGGVRAACISGTAAPTRQLMVETASPLANACGARMTGPGRSVA